MGRTYITRSLLMLMSIVLPFLLWSGEAVTSEMCITTVAGNGECYFSGDGGQATVAQLHRPSGLVFDSAGNLYIADTDNHRIRKVDPTGKITTFAGTGALGFSGDGGQATVAQLWSPSRLAIDHVNNLYIADTENHRIRKVDSTGKITTIAGTGSPGFSGDNGQATAAQLNYPYGLVFDSMGNLYIADTNNHRIRKVDPTGKITTIAGTGNLGFSGDDGPAIYAEFDTPMGLAIDADDLYIADTFNGRIRKFNIYLTKITTVAGGGATATELTIDTENSPATGVRLSDPTGVAFDPSTHTLYIAENSYDSASNRILKVDNEGKITIFAGLGSWNSLGDGDVAKNAYLYIPTDLAIDSVSNLYIADSENLRIRKVDASEIITTVAGNGESCFSGDGGLARESQLNAPYGVVVSAGNIYIADQGNYRIRKVGSDEIITTVAGIGNFGLEPGFFGEGVPATKAKLNSPAGIAVDSANNLYIADTDNHRIRKVDTTGKITTVENTSLPDGIAFDPKGKLYIASSYYNFIKTKIDDVMSTIAGQSSSWGDFSGDGANAKNAKLNSPTGIAFDSAGNLYIADMYNHRIRKVDSKGIITTFAGTKNTGLLKPASASLGDGGLATEAHLYYPTGLSVDSADNLYIADRYNNRIRKVFPCCGDNSIRSGEECDGSDLNGAACLSQGFTGGNLSCNADCTINVAGCESSPAVTPPPGSETSTSTTGASTGDGDQTPPTGGSGAPTGGGDQTPPAGGSTPKSSAGASGGCSLIWGK